MSRIEVHVGEGFDAVRRRTLDAVARSDAGEAVSERHLSFATWDAFAAAFSPKRLELLRHLRRHSEPSVAALARALGRDYRRVHDDVEALAAAGLVERDGGRLAAPFDEAKVALAL